ncbi:DUF6906 family protein [Clostridium gasigenes]|uniref:DUF6906 family protein n=1 Tax=Clostridium gasigenes TaxID=94869 RepID=UPI001C0D40F5|nr:hypothetical protein [Clostridium gasigenes]MBU3107180.1 hypothetical protein [Clostridium gasigenes]
MKKLRCLNLQQKIFLENEGLKPKDFLMERVTLEDYVFYNIHTKMLWEMRR